MDAKRVEEAIEIVKRGRYEEKAKEYNEAINLLISISQSYLSVLKDSRVPVIGVCAQSYKDSICFDCPNDCKRCRASDLYSKMLPLIVADRERIKELEKQIRDLLITGYGQRT